MTFSSYLKHINFSVSYILKNNTDCAKQDVIFLKTQQRIT